MSKFSAAEGALELTRTQREDGKQDARNGHVQVASQAKAAPEEHGPDAKKLDEKNKNF